MTFAADPDFLGLELSPAQIVTLKAISGLELSGPVEWELYRLLTGGRKQFYIGHWYRDVALVCGARAGKTSRILSPILLYQVLRACLGLTQQTAGETLCALMIAQHLAGAKVCSDFATAQVTGSKYMRALLTEPPTGTVMKFEGDVQTRCYPCSSSSVRGVTGIWAAMDESAWFVSGEGVELDAAVEQALRSRMLTTSGGVVKSSTPWLRSGILYKAWETGWGVDSHDLLVIHAPTLLFNPTISHQVLEEERRRDPMRASHEIDALFSDTVSNPLLPDEIVQTLIVHGRYQLPPVPGTEYWAFVDVAGGGADSFAVAISHCDATRGKAVLDALASWPGITSPTAVIDEVSALLRRYGVWTVVGDSYGGSFRGERFTMKGIGYVPAPEKNVLFLEFEMLAREQRCELLDVGPMLSELRGLSKRPAGNRYIVDHPPGGHDDLINVAAGALVIAGRVLTRGTGRPTSELDRQLGDATVSGDVARLTAECQALGAQILELVRQGKLPEELATLDVDMKIRHLESMMKPDQLRHGLYGLKVELEEHVSSKTWLRERLKRAGLELPPVDDIDDEDWKMRPGDDPGDDD